MASYRIESKESCTTSIKIKVKDNIIKLIEFEGGCNIIYEALGRLVTERKLDDIINLLKDIKENCVNKKSCIQLLVELLILARNKEEEAENQKLQIRKTPDGILNNINTLLSKTKLDTEKDAILIKVNPIYLEQIKENVNLIRDKINCEIYIEEFGEFTGDYIFSTVGKRTSIE